MSEIRRSWAEKWKWFNKPKEATDRWGNELTVLGTTPAINSDAPTKVGEGFFYQRKCDPEGHLGSSRGSTIVFKAREDIEPPKQVKNVSEWFTLQEERKRKMGK